jgi:hypothetical protein
MRSEVDALIEMVFRQLGGRATNQDIQIHVRTILTPEQRSWLADYAMGPIIGGFFRRRNGRLPQAPEVDSAGTHCQLELITEDEYRYVIRKYVQRSDQNMTMAFEFAKECRAVHGIWIDPHDLYGDETGT